jgi:hypothetical protein
LELEMKDVILNSTADFLPNATTIVDADSLSRVVKLALDTGEVGSVAAGYELFQSYRLSVVVGREVGVSLPHQAALLTIVNTARRALLGGVFVVAQRSASHANSRCEMPL